MYSRINQFVGLLALAVAGSATGQCEQEWNPVGGGRISGDFVKALMVFDDGSGSALYAGGRITATGNPVSNNIAKWNGTTWSSLGAGAPSEIRALIVFDDGSGPALYAGGEFGTVGGVSANSIGRWDGVAWAPLGAGLRGGQPRGVFAMTVFDDGSGAALYAGGGFTTAGVAQANRIARWNGTSWSPLGEGMSTGAVTALAVFDDGSGPALYAGGGFTTAGGTQTNNVAKWDGVSWSSLGGGVDSVIDALTVFDDGSGPALYAGGRFSMAGGVRASRIAKWDGTSWSPLGGGVSDDLRALFVFDDGSGQALYAGGSFLRAGGGSAKHIAKWDGTSWSPLGAGTNGFVFALTVFGEGSGSALVAGGNGPDFVARWGIPVPEVTSQPADLSVNVRDPAVFRLQASSAPGPMSIQWRKDGQALLEDPPRITGTQTTMLSIDSTILSDAGRYDALLTNMCGPTLTRSALLTVMTTTCYPDCDQSTGIGVLDLFDFLCFQNAFVRFEPYADCDGNNVLNLFDFLCFQGAFVAGCP